MTKLVQIGVDLIPSNGGIYKSARQFSLAFNSDPILSFTKSTDIPRNPDNDGIIRHFPLSTNKLLEWYGHAPTRERRAAFAAAEKAQLLCCHIMLRHHACWTRQVARTLRLPYWIVVHGQLDPHVYTHRAGMKKLWLELFGKKILADAAHVIFSTEREREKAKWIYRGTNSRVVHWPVELLDLRSKEEAKTELASRLNMRRNDRLLIYLGRLHSGKRVLETIDAFAAANAPNTHLAVIGPDGDISADCCVHRTLCKGVPDRVHIIGPAYGVEKERFLLGADAYISLSEKENFGHTVAESLSAGIPVILSPGNDLSHDLQEQQCGLLLDSHLKQTAVKAIERFSQLPDSELLSMGQRGRAFAEQKLSATFFKKNLQKLAAEALNR